MQKTNLTVCLCLMLIMATIFITPSGWAQKPNFTLGLVSDGLPKENADAAYNWAKTRFDAQNIPCPKAKDELIKFGVIWWDESNGPSIPDVFKDKSTIDAFVGYVEDGGGLLLSNLAFHYVYEMGLEPENLRYFAANANWAADWTDIQIAEGQENHPIFKGMKVEQGIIQYDMLGYTDGSDFYGAAGPLGPKYKDSILLGQTVDGHPQCNGLVEYRVGRGTIVIIGWVWSSWMVNKKLEDVHAPLHENIIKYLASRSRFAAVDAEGKLTVTWGALKSGH